MVKVGQLYIEWQNKETCKHVDSFCHMVWTLQLSRYMDILLHSYHQKTYRKC